MRLEPQKRGLLCLRLGGGRAKCQTGQEERAVLELVQDYGGLAGGTQLPETWATPVLPPDWPGEGATMLGQRILSVGFVLKTEWCKVFS